MRVRIDNPDDRDYGVIELAIEDGYHAGMTVLVYLADDGAPVVQIDTPQETETHELMRVWVNDALVSGVTADASSIEADPMAAQRRGL